MSEIITRFAPSPTGNLHIGGIRTALINYIFTKKAELENKNSKFLLRIENTDKLRSSVTYEKSIIESLKWLDINWDDKIYKQSDSINKHILIAKKLLKTKGAYKCICTKEQLDKKRQKKLKSGEKIKRLCNTCEKNIEIQNIDQNYCIRLKVPEYGSTEFEDIIQGKVSISNEEIDNYILLRTDGTPTYMLSVVVDDFDMNITHIIRGDDHLNNAFRQIQLYKNLNWKIPKFGHIPLLHGEDGKKLSKRHGSINVIDFKKEGYLKKSMINYLLKIGTSFIEDDFFEIDDLIKVFDINKFSKSPSRFDYNKLNFINSYYISNLKNENLINNLINIDKNFKKLYENVEINNILDLYKKRSSTLLELNRKISPYLNYNNTNIDKFDQNNESHLIIKKFYICIKNEMNWSKENIEKISKEFVKNNNIKFLELGKPLRVILLGTSDAPSISEIMHALGKDKVLKRINNFLI
tara:strand:+ start:140 stop:1537 length:1398 start_codon:yes stop_codon:yes gene_type:complete